jgi:hypothetical protein
LAAFGRGRTGVDRGLDRKTGADPIEHRIGGRVEQDLDRNALHDLVKFPVAFSGGSSANT